MNLDEYNKAVYAEAERLDLFSLTDHLPNEKYYRFVLLAVMTGFREGIAPEALAQSMIRVVRGYLDSLPKETIQ